MGLFDRHPAEHAAETGAGRDQRAGLLREHPQVVRDRVLAGQRAGRLGDLPVDQPGERVGLDADGLDAELGDHVGGAGEEVVADQDGDRVAPARVGAGRAAAHQRLVHDVVVVQRREVGELDHRRGEHHLLVVRVAEVSGQRHEQRPEPLAAGIDEMPGGLGDQRVGARDRVDQHRLDVPQDRRDAGLQLRIGEAQADRRAEALGRYHGINDAIAALVAGGGPGLA